MKKYILDLKVVSNTCPHERYVLLKVTNPNGTLPEMCPGQFAQLRIDGAENAFLRRPISIHYVDEGKNELWFLIQIVGEGTRTLSKLQPGSTLNAILPLGNGFTIPQNASKKALLVGGGVGIAPLLFLGRKMTEMGVRPTFLLGARSVNDLLQLDLFRQFGSVYITTEDGSAGEKGFVTQHSLLQRESFDYISTCGPKPMMMSVAHYAKSRAIQCEASLENMMACGVGACLCCVEDTQQGHICVCKEGPVFNINELKWQI